MILNRSLVDRQYRLKPDSRRMDSLERLADGGYLKNNRQMKANWYMPSFPRLLEMIGSMNNLETLSLLGCELTLTKDLPQLIRSCPKLTELRIKLFDNQKLEKEVLKNDLRPGFKRLRLFELYWHNDSLPLIQKMFT